MRFRGEIIGEVIGFARTESDDAMIINQKSRRSKNANFGNKKRRTSAWEEKRSLMMRKMRRQRRCSALIASSRAGEHCVAPLAWKNKILLHMIFPTNSFAFAINMHKRVGCTWARGVQEELSRRGDGGRRKKNFFANFEMMTI